jgi:hypothetical protein
MDTRKQLVNVGFEYVAYEYDVNIICQNDVFD